MASASDIATVRRNVDEPTTDTYTDEEIGSYIDADSVAGASAVIWREKAAAASDLVDVTEAGATHKMSELRKAYLANAAYYDGLAVAVPGAGAPKVKKIVRS